MSALFSIRIEFKETSSDQFLGLLIEALEDIDGLDVLHVEAVEAGDFVVTVKGYAPDLSGLLGKLGQGGDACGLKQIRVEDPAAPNVPIFGQDDISLDELELSTSTLNKLKRAGLRTSADLRGKSLREIDAIPGFGHETFVELIGVVIKHGLKLRTS